MSRPSRPRPESEEEARTCLRFPRLADVNQSQNTPAVPGRSPSLHDAVRPLWQADVLSWLLGTPAPGKRPETGDHQAPGRQLAVVDLGAGTGLGTRAMAALGHRVTAVDTDPGMLAVLDAARTELPSDIAGRITTAVGAAEHLPLAEKSADAIVCLQAWHWVDPGPAIAECDRVLKHGGTLGVAWHTWDRSSAWVQALAALVEPDGAPADQTRSVPQEFAGRGGFERRDFPFSYELTVEKLVDLAKSWQFVMRRPDHQRVLAEIRSLGEQTKSPDTGRVSFPHITAAFRLHRIPRTATAS